jgi:DNA polymerase-3 subunit epsilon
MKAAPTFVALDFETADRQPDSACAVAIVRVESLRIVRTDVYLLRPPRRDFVFTYVHGISWKDVRRKPTFAEQWPKLAEHLEGAAFIAAHSSGFDESVLRTCCRIAKVRSPKVPFVCTVQIARNMWEIYPTKLPDVCTELSIPLKHHDPVSDAKACANIVIKAMKAGWTR